MNMHLLKQAGSGEGETGKEAGFPFPPCRCDARFVAKGIYADDV
jgi:hypothetical protein